MKGKQYFEVNYNNFEKVNEEFVKCTISVLSCTQKANGTKFTREAVEKAKQGLNYVPVIGYFKGDDFADHGMEIVIDADGYHEKVKTVPFGVCIKDSSRWEKLQKENGEYEEYLVVDAYLWGRYNEAISVVRENKCGQSMEICVQDGEYTGEGYYSIKDFSFSALCILGENVQPAFNLAKIRTSNKFSADELKESYKEMLDKLAYTLTITEESVEEEPVIDQDGLEEPVINYEEKYNEVVKEMEELKISYLDLQTLHEKDLQELEELRLFKQEIVYNNHIHEVDEALAPYSELEEVEGYAELIKDKYEADLGELVRNIKIFCFDNNIVLGKKEKKKNTKENKIKVPLINNDKIIDTNSDWSFMSKYKKNK